MDARLYVVHGSHPCAAVAKALEVKGIAYRTFEWPPAMHAPAQKLIFGARTVPGLRIGGEKLQGSRAIMRRLDELRPEPPLLPADPASRARVLEAEAWGDEVFQPLGRRIIWPALKRNPAAGPSLNEHSKIKLPAPMVRASLPLIARVEIAMNRASDDAAREDLRALPGHLDRIDAWIAEGVMGGGMPNAADLQIASTVRLLLVLADLRPLIDPRPIGQLARRLWPQWDGELPPGSLPADWLPAAAVV